MTFVEISKVESSDGGVLAFVAFRRDYDRFGFLRRLNAQMTRPNVLFLELQKNNLHILILTRNENRKVKSLSDVWISMSHALTWYVRAMSLISVAERLL